MSRPLVLARAPLRLADLAPREFHVSRASRQRYRFDDAIFTTTGNVVFPSYRAAQLFAQRINEERDTARHPETAVSAGQINAIGLLDEILHAIVRAYRERLNPDAFARASAWLDDRLGPGTVDVVLARFADLFPPLAVHRGEVTVPAYLRGSTDGVPNRLILLEELLMLWLSNENPALSVVSELLDDAALERGTLYLRLIEALREFFAGEPAFGGEQQSLVELLRAPVVASPDSLAGQLRFVLERWRGLVADVLVRRGADLDTLLAEIARSLDYIAEETRPRFLGPGPAPVLEFRSDDRARFDPWTAAERYSPDRDWMPELVLIAKNTYVWLDQLSRTYGRPITRLDQIPDEELDLLARWGITGLWFIGIWERSAASARIKQLTGNPEAIASAYSVHDYVVAETLGGPAALEELRTRASVRGIRLASDMVPNHTAIDSRWVMQHPDWFIGLDHSPFPSYTFNGPDLSHDERVEVKVEDHYYDRTDAAVVFRRTDRWTGTQRYIYHGNDGTAYPWVDTAQLDYLHPEVREAVIQTILHVARQFPVIRFDAAMTLTKLHFQRLWYPEPGTGGDIPSRAQHGLTKAEFDRRMPEEFWREVVDRVATEAPDTLLLAEAFWLLEGYFVRTLGMHRVYNSAFMNMLRDEENARYRQVLKNTLEYDPAILARYVNFMSNPDERTAIDQFGKGDKYIGVAVMMATLPGLPMFGHGQIEGFAERYGMEYRRAYHDEVPDAELVGHHEREIAPLLGRRYLFSGVDSFLLYDLFTSSGGVDENVFAYSNRHGGERALIVYHNRFADTRGWIRTSVGFSERARTGEWRLVQRTLSEGLGIAAEDDLYVVYRDRVTGLEYVRSSHELASQGLYVELGAYGRLVLVDFREVRSSEREPYALLAHELGGRGVRSVSAELRKITLEPILAPFRRMIEPERLRSLVEASRSAKDPTADAETSALLASVEERAASLDAAVTGLFGRTSDAKSVAGRDTRDEVAAAIALDGRKLAAPKSERARLAAIYWKIRPDDSATRAVLLVTALVRKFARAVDESPGVEDDWLDEWALREPIARSLEALGLDRRAAERSTVLVGLLARRPARDLTAPAREGFGRLADLLASDAGKRFVGSNEYQGVVWFNHESLIELRWWLGIQALVGASLPADAASLDRALVTWRAFAQCVDREVARSGYHLDRLLTSLETLSRRGGSKVAAAGSREVSGEHLDPRESI